MTLMFRSIENVPVKRIKTTSTFLNTKAAAEEEEEEEEDEEEDEAEDEEEDEAEDEEEGRLWNDSAKRYHKSQV
ncbi:hypothetical protein RUND412_001805 [Rhizina undulata]